MKYQNLKEAAKADLRVKLIALNAHTRKEEVSKISSLNFYLQNQRKKRI